MKPKNTSIRVKNYLNHLTIHVSEVSYKLIELKIKDKVNIQEVKITLKNTIIGEENSIDDRTKYSLPQ